MPSSVMLHERFCHLLEEPAPELVIFILQRETAAVVLPLSFTRCCSLIKIILTRRGHSELALVFITQELWRQQWSSAAASHHAREFWSSLSQRMFWKPKIESASKAAWRIEEGKAHLRLLNVQICLQPPFQEVLQRWQKSEGHSGRKTIPEQIFYSVCNHPPQVLVKGRHWTWSDLGRPFPCSCPCSGLSHNFRSTCCTL